MEQLLSDLYREESRRVLATLIRLVGDFELAEEMMQEAFETALKKWPSDGVPSNPRSWLISTARFKAIDRIRRRDRFQELQATLVDQDTATNALNEERENDEWDDDRLRLIFTCCHPSIAREVQVALTLREVCGLTTEQVARAFLVAPTTMAQRIVRGKAKIKLAKIPYRVPEVDDLPERLENVLAVIYLVYNEGYSRAVDGVSLSEEAIRLARLLLELLPDPEAQGLLALMLLHESRRVARVDRSGEIILLEDQDRTLWDRERIEEGTQLAHTALSSGSVGPYAIQAAISALHAQASRADQTDWAQIVSLYDLLLVADPSPVVELNRAVAMAMRGPIETGLGLVDRLVDDGPLRNYPLAHAARADLNRRLGRWPTAATAYAQALELTDNPADRRYLERRLAQAELALKDGVPSQGSLPS